MEEDSLWRDAIARSDENEVKKLWKTIKLKKNNKWSPQRL